MKSKILLSTLLSGALLAGCTADDALDAGKVAQKANPAAPVFTVSFDDNDMRAVMGETAIRWQASDKMSLFHGGAWDATTEQVKDNAQGSDFLTSGQVRQFNAIYAQAEDAADAKFTTQSMVTEGLAIMIFPADTAYAQTGVNPHITLTNEQKADTKNLTPYVSEMLNITKHGDLNKEGNEHSAGYGREYQIVLRRIGGQMRLGLNAEGADKITAAGVPATKFKKVTIEVDKDETTKVNPFTTDLEVKVGRLRTSKDGETEDPEITVGKNVEDNMSYWMYSPYMEPATTPLAGSTASSVTNVISTTDITEEKTVPAAVFTLLPYDDRDNAVIELDEDGTFKAPKYKTVDITVETTYGKVELADEEDNKLWSGDDYSDETTLLNGLASFQYAMFKPQDGKKRPQYKNQLVAGYGTRNLVVDLSTLDMNNLHIEDQAHLLNALKVYDKIYKESTDEKKQEEKITFILDGTDGEFVLDAEGWAELEARCADEDTHITFVPCDVEDEDCLTVVLDNSEGTETVDVPALQFGKSVNDNNVVDLKLLGSWTYLSSEANGKVKKLEGIANLIVADELVFAEETVINSAATDQFNVIIEDAATVNVEEGVMVTVLEKLYNHGTITINNVAYLRSGKDGYIENCYAPTLQADGKTKNTGFTVGGTIINYGTLGAVQTTNGIVNNYGLIQVKNEDAFTLLTNNATHQTTSWIFSHDFGTAHSDGTQTRIGSIELFDKNGGTNKRTNVEKFQGFIKLIMTDDVVTTNDTGDSKGVNHVGDVANYLVLKGTTKSIQSIGTKVKYIEIDNGGAVTTFENTTTGNSITLDGLIVRKGNNAFIPAASQGVQATVIYTPEGYITKAKSEFLTNPQFTGYYGGKADDYKRVTISGSGQ